MGSKLKIKTKTNARESRNRTVLSKFNKFNTGNNTPRSIDR